MKGVYGPVRRTVKGMFELNTSRGPYRIFVGCRMDQCLAKTGRMAAGRRCQRRSGYGHKFHFCRVHAELFEKGADKNHFHARGWYVWHTYTYRFPGVRSIRTIRRDLERDRPNRAARMIQRAWRRCISNPEYNMCRVRLTREYEELK